MAEQTTGVRIEHSVASDVLYGFRMDPATSHLNVEVLSGADVISLPQEGVIDPNDFRQWLVSTNTLDFTVDGRGHLIMTVY